LAPSVLLLGKLQASSNKYNIMKANEVETIEPGKLRKVITPELRTLEPIFSKAGHSIRIVGGAVRDLLLGKIPKDIDLATDATPDKMVELFKKADIKYIPTGIKHGTVTAVIDAEQYEITTLRADTKTDGRRADVDFITSWEEDAKRRDLTYNAMSLDFKGRLYDYTGGLDDLQDKTSKFVGDPAERIKEDYLRILRYFRFQSKLPSAKFDTDTLDAIKANAGGLKKISPERIWMETKKILMSDNLIVILDAMNDTGVARIIGLPVGNARKASKIVVDDANSYLSRLAMLVDNDSLVKKWRMSNDEATILQFMLAYKNKKIDLQTAKDMLVDGISKEKLLMTLKFQSNFQVARQIADWNPPEFPVLGRDFIELGMKPGPDIGYKLKQAKDLWKKSGYKLSKEQILAKLK